ncbi:MAG: polysaccharide biosynthesis/export family protein [Myxococcales bacterium]|nr:polysaccharide biosynthesis/export family protein [Myxococcales bacterium]
MRAHSALLVFSLALASTASSGCRSALTGPWPPIESGTAEYRLGAGDVLRISVYGNNDLSSRVTVRPDGRVTLPLINEIVVQGKTVNDVTLEVTEGYRRYVQDARVSVIIEEVHSYRVFVVGKVVRPGDFESRTPVTVMQALSLAGGAARGADVDHIVVLRNGPGGRHERYEVSYTEIAEGRLQQNFTLRSGDTLIVP